MNRHDLIWAVSGLGIGLGLGSIGLALGNLDARLFVIVAVCGVAAGLAWGIYGRIDSKPDSKEVMPEARRHVA